MNRLIKSNGQPLNEKEMVKYDTIIPDFDLSIEESTKIFKGERVISVWSFIFFSKKYK